MLGLAFYVKYYDKCINFNPKIDKRNINILLLIKKLLYMENIFKISPAYATLRPTLFKKEGVIG